MKRRIICFFLAVATLAAVLPLSVSAYGHMATNPLPEGIYKSWKQTDERWKDLVIGKDGWTDSAGVWHEDETMGHAGCLITSMAILTRAYGLTLIGGQEITPATLAIAMYDGGSCKYLTEGGAARVGTAFNALIPGVKFCSDEQSDDYVARIRQLLSNSDKEYIIIIGVNGNKHYVAADYVKDGNVYICDPGYNRTQLSEYTPSRLLVFSVDEQYVDPSGPPAESTIWVVTEATGVRVRTGPGLEYERLFVYPQGTKIEVFETAEADDYLWGRTPDGWCALRMLNGEEIYCEPANPTETYSVTYHTNGGDGGPEAQIKTAGTDLQLSTVVPTKEGYRFLGWSPDPSAVSADYVPGGWYRKDAHLALYAVWMPESDIFGFGIDVSAYQGNVDWNAVAGDGISFVILRAGTSNGKDEKFEENYRGAKAAGLHVGSYFFSYALTDAEAERDAAMFREWLAGKTFDMPVYLDLETEEQAQLSPERLVQLALHFQKAMEDTGLLCGVYSSASWFEKQLDRDRLGGREALWVAKWTASGTPSQNMSEKYGMYQYSETGRVAGINTTVDLDICYIDYPTLLAGPWQGDKEDPRLKPDSGLQVQEGVIFGGRPGMTVPEWSALFDEEVTFRHADGTLMEADETVVTGCAVDCGNRRYPIGVRGDVTGDGSVDALDYMLVKRYVLNTYNLEGAFYYAGCLSSQTLGALDYALLKRHVLGTFNLYGTD